MSKELEKVAEDESTRMTEMVLPSHTNALGSIFGGVIMSWIDICGAIAAQRHARKPVVTASIDSLEFVAPVYTGWTVNLRASVNYVGKTSMEVGVRVDAENPMTGEHFHTATAYLTFVALDSLKRPTALPPLQIKTEEQKRRHADAARRREQRLKNRKKPN